MFKVVPAVVFAAIACWLASDRLAAQQEPTATEIIDTYLRALGGEEALHSVASMKVTSKQRSHVKDKTDEGTFEQTDTLLLSHGRWVQFDSRGDRFGFDGTRYWFKSTNQDVQWRDDFRYPFNNRDPISYPLHLASFPGTLEFAGTKEAGGRSLYRVDVEPTVAEPSGMIRMTPQELYFDAESGLLVQIVHETKTVAYHDYRDVHGFMVPFQMKSTNRIEDIVSEHEMTIISIGFNVEIDDRLLSPALADD